MIRSRTPTPTPPRDVAVDAVSPWQHSNQRSLDGTFPGRHELSLHEQQSLDAARSDEPSPPTTPVGPRSTQQKSLHVRTTTTAYLPYLELQWSVVVTAPAIMPEPCTDHWNSPSLADGLLTYLTFGLVTAPSGLAASAGVGVRAGIGAVTDVPVITGCLVSRGYRSGC